MASTIDLIVAHTTMACGVCFDLHSGSTLFDIMWPHCTFFGNCPYENFIRYILGWKQISSGIRYNRVRELTYIARVLISVVQATRLCAQSWYTLLLSCEPRVASFTAAVIAFSVVVCTAEACGVECCNCSANIIFSTTSPLFFCIWGCSTSSSWSFLS